MTLLITLVVVSLIAIVCSTLIKKYTFIFYVLAIVLDGAYIYFRFFADYNPVIFSLLQAMQKGLIAFALFAVVMFIGVLSESSKLRTRLYPIRGELSLLGFLFALGHIGGYLTSYLMTLVRDSGVLPPSVLLSIVVSFTSFILLLILGVTTFNFVRSAMNSDLWKRIQRLSYVFFGLVYIHLMLMLMPAMRNNVTTAIISASIYTAILGAYVVLRVLKAKRDKSTARTLQSC
jgi:DMSO/TMAO reductase YedYZ heme-binding membrane subunit